MSALVRTIRKAILGTAANRNQVLKESIEELGIEAGQTAPGSMRKLQKIILNSGRDDEVQLRRAFTGLNLTGGAVGGGEARRIQNALLRSGRESELRSAIDDLIEIGGAEAPEWLPEGAAFHVDFDNGQYYWGGEEKVEADLGEILGESILLNVSFDPQDIDENGYSGAAALIGTLKAAVLAGCTLRAEFINSLIFEQTEAAFMTDIALNYSNISQTGSLNDQITETPLVVEATGGSHKVATTITSETMFASADNVRFASEEFPELTAVVPGMPNPPTDLQIGGFSIQSFTVWTTPKNEADTQALTV